MTDEGTDPWAYGTTITVDHPLHATIAAWAEIERTLVEGGFPQPQAEQWSKTLLARLAHLDPPVLVVHPSEMKGEE